mmetsp:Transcript_25085/g.98954  ORF Transcript_25085/g.98954 Transcript_25085/m.98954 type:complete len:276 (-) Transcript_25085:385-1212(-)
MTAPPLIPPLRFQIVEENLYRGAFPSLKNYRFLRRLKLKTIISLTPGDVSSADIREFNSHEDLRDFCQNEGVKLIHFNVAKHAGMVMMTPNLVARVVSLMIRVENYPLYVHCRDGGNNTGLVIMVLRRLQNWNLSSIFIEFMRHLKASETLSREESQFVESFRAVIDVPPTIPKWLWQGRVQRHHPTMQLNIISPPPSKDPKSPSNKETTRRRQEIMQDITKGSKRVETSLIRGLLLANGRESDNPRSRKEQAQSRLIQGLGLEGLYPLTKRSGR